MGTRRDIWIWARRSEQEPQIEPKGVKRRDGETRVEKLGNRKSQRSVVKMSSPRQPGVASLFATDALPASVAFPSSLLPPPVSLGPTPFPASVAS